MSKNFGVDVEISNILPERAFDESDYPGNYGDIFVFAEHLYTAKVSLVSPEGKLEFPRMGIVRFGRQLFSQAWNINFEAQESGGFSESGQNHYFNVLYSLVDRTVKLQIFVTQYDPLIFNGVAYGGGESITIDYDLLNFNRLCGLLQFRVLNIMEDMLQNMDGVREYFAWTPFFEGFVGGDGIHVEDF